MDHYSDNFDENGYPLNDYGNDGENAGSEIENIDDVSRLSNNTLAFIALANEYCAAVENCQGTDTDSFVSAMLRLLPRIYISVLDIKANMMTGEGEYIPPVLTEENYEAVRSNIASLLGENDTFLEVFEEDMKYSDTPISATISESLADLFQVLYDIVENCREAPIYLINEMMAGAKETFAGYWSQTLVNVLRALNNLKYNS